MSELLLAWRFLGAVDDFQRHTQPLLQKLNSPYGATELLVVPFFADLSLLVMLLLLSGLLAMLLIADERRSGRLQLLLAAPVSSTEIVLGKYCGGLLFTLLVIAVWSLLPVSMLLGTPVDLDRIAAALLGLVLLAAAMVALACWGSTLSREPGVAVAVSFATGLLLMVLHNGAALADHDGGVFPYLGSLDHYGRFLAGVVTTSAIAYFVLLLVGFLGFAIRRLDSIRIQP